MSSWYADAWRSAVDSEPGMFPVGADVKPGRTLARKLAPLQPGVLELQPGSATHRHDSDREAWVCTISVRPLPGPDWERFMAQIADRPKLAAAVLTGQFPAGLEDPAADAGIALIPDHVDQICSCDSWEEPCKHAVALALLIAEVIETDPFVIVLFLGRGRDDLVDGVQAARSGFRGVASAEPEKEPRGPDPTIDAATAFQRPLGSPPRSQPLPRRAGSPIELTSPPPSDSGVVADDLKALVADAAGRATAMLLGEGNAALHLSPDDDVVRMAAESGADLNRLAAAVGADPDVLASRLQAWQVGGEDGLRVQDHRWEPPSDALRQAEQLFAGRVRRSANAVIAGRVQLRLAENGTWWQFDADSRTGWQLAAGPFDDPADGLESPS